MPLVADVLEITDSEDDDATASATVLETSLDLFKDSMHNLNEKLREERRVRHPCLRY